MCPPCSGSQKDEIALISAILALQANSCDQNLNHCLELIEQVAKVQGQLFGILTVAAQEGENGPCVSLQFSPLCLLFLFPSLCSLPGWMCLAFSRSPGLWILPGGHSDGVETIKSRLLPWLEASFTAASLGKPVDSKVPSLQVGILKDHPRYSAPDQALGTQTYMR